MSESTIEKLILRPIHPNDNLNLLSLGNAEFTPLKIFLQKNALDFHQYEIAKTYVLVEENSSAPRVWGYITIMSSEIVILNHDDRPQETLSTSRYEAFPAVKIARLAIDKRLHKQGYGAQLLNWCISHVRIAIMPYVGCRFLVVDSKKNSVQFYAKSGFELLEIDTEDSKEYPMMFLDLYKNFTEAIS